MIEADRAVPAGAGDREGYLGKARIGLSDEQDEECALAGIDALEEESDPLEEKRGRALERGNLIMIYRDVIETMIATVEEAMSRVVDWWGELPMPTNEAMDRFWVQLGAAIDSVEFVKRALDRPARETPHRRPLMQGSAAATDRKRGVMLFANPAAQQCLPRTAVCYPSVGSTGRTAR